jgi:hypothetical protein
MRLQARVDKLEQHDAQSRATQRIQVVYGDDEPEEVLPGDVVLRVVYADDPHGSTDLPGSSRARGGSEG